MESQRFVLEVGIQHPVNSDDVGNLQQVENIVCNHDYLANGTVRGCPHPICKFLICLAACQIICRVNVIAESTNLQSKSFLTIQEHGICQQHYTTDNEV